MQNVLLLHQELSVEGGCLEEFARIGSNDDVWGFVGFDDEIEGFDAVVGVFFEEKEAGLDGFGGELESEEEGGWGGDWEDGLAIVSGEDDAKVEDVG